MRKMHILKLVIVLLLISACSNRTVKIKALSPAEVTEISSKKYIAVNEFKYDRLGISGKIESKLAKHKVNKEKYFVVLSRKDIDNVIREQKLQSSELMDEKTSVRIGKLIGAEAIINGEVTSNAESNVYYDRTKTCRKYVKDKGCVKWNYFRVKCNTTQATVSLNVNIVDVENGSLIYGDTISRDYSADSCRSVYGYLLSNPTRILSKSQALDKLALQVANSFVYKLTPNYIYLSVDLLEDIELDSITSEQEKKFENSLTYIELGRIDRAEQILSELMDELDAKSYVVSYTYGVIQELQGDFNEARELYLVADEETPEPIQEINRALIRIGRLIEKRDEARRQIDAK